MMRVIKGLAVLVTGLLLANCHGDYRPEAQGTFGEAVVVMDSAQWQSKTAQAIREVYGQGIETLPKWEPMVDLRFRDFRNNNELEQLRKNKNLIIAAPITDSTNTAKFVRALLSDNVEQKVKSGNLFAFPLQNQWYRDQWTVILTSTSDSALARKIQQSKQTLANQLLNVEMNRWKNSLYSEAERKGLEDSLWAHNGWNIRVVHDWVQSIDTTYTEHGVKNHFMTLRRDLQDNRRWFWAWWVDDTKNIDSLSTTWINAKRDSLMETFVRGTRDSSYITTDYTHYPVLTDTLTVDGHPAYETQGVWHMTHDAMAGPFANMTIRDKSTGRLFMIEFGQFAPKYSKRRFVRQFRAMLRTFKSDSSWNPSSDNKTQASE